MLTDVNKGGGGGQDHVNVSKGALKEEDHMKEDAGKIRDKAKRFARWAANMLLTVKGQDLAAGDRLGESGSVQD